MNENETKQKWVNIAHFMMDKASQVGGEMCEKKKSWMATWTPTAADYVYDILVRHLF